MIALGIMAVGMSMAAALFPAAIKENEKSCKNVMCQIVSSNALVVAQIVVKQSAPVWAAASAQAGNVVVIADDQPVNQGSVTSAQMQYPVAGGTGYGCVLLGRIVNMTMSGGSTDNPAGTNVYDLYAVSYKKNTNADQVWCIPLPGLGAGNTTTTFTTNGVTAPNSSTWAIIGPSLVGSPMFAPDGEYINILGWDGANLITDRAFSVAGAALITPTVPVYVVVECSAAASPTYSPCPVMNVLETRTGLASQ
jgi:hypothetical protein